MEIDEHDHAHEGEWKWQLAATLLCAAFALAGSLLPEARWSLAGYLLAYLAGG